MCSIRMAYIDIYIYTYVSVGRLVGFSLFCVSLICIYKYTLTSIYIYGTVVVQFGSVQFSCPGCRSVRRSVRADGRISLEYRDIFAFSVLFFVSNSCLKFEWQSLSFSLPLSLPLACSRCVCFHFIPCEQREKCYQHPSNGNVLCIVTQYTHTHTHSLTMYGHKQRSQYYCWFLNMFIAIVLVISFIFLLLFVYHFNSFRFISLNYGACDWELVAAFRMMLVQRTKANLLFVLHVQKRYTHGFKLTFACVFEHEYTYTYFRPSDLAELKLNEENKKIKVKYFTFEDPITITNTE